MSAAGIIFREAVREPNANELGNGGVTWLSMVKVEGLPPKPNHSVS